MVAELLEHFHLTLSEFARLTQRQQLDLYYHKRDKEGGISSDKAEEEAATPVAPVAADEPEREPTLEEELRNVDVLAGILHFPPQEVQRLKSEVREKFARLAAEKEASDGDSDNG